MKIRLTNNIEILSKWLPCALMLSHIVSFLIFTPASNDGFTKENQTDVSISHQLNHIVHPVLNYNLEDISEEEENIKEITKKKLIIILALSKEYAAIAGLIKDDLQPKTRLILNSKWINHFKVLRLLFFHQLKLDI